MRSTTVLLAAAVAALATAAMAQAPTKKPPKPYHFKHHHLISREQPSACPKCLPPAPYVGNNPMTVASPPK